VNVLPDKWIEVDIHLNNYTRTDEVIRETVKELVQDFKTKNWIRSWHFFREPQIRLRFYGEAENIDKVKEAVDSKLNERESTKGDLYSCHVFGSHGRRNEEYVGESGFWLNDWLSVMKLWENTAEFALSMIDSASKPLDVHGERHVHLLLNQLGLPHEYTDLGNEIVIIYRRRKHPDELR